MGGREEGRAQGVLWKADPKGAGLERSGEGDGVAGEFQASTPQAGGTSLGSALSGWVTPAGYLTPLSLASSLLKEVNDFSSKLLGVWVVTNRLELT